MADVHSKEVRSYNMSRIKGKNTKPEMLVRRFLHYILKDELYLPFTKEKEVFMQSTDSSWKPSVGIA